MGAAMIGFWLSPWIAIAVGVGYPSVQTFTALKAFAKGTDAEGWKDPLAYWIGFGLLAVVEAYAGSLLRWIPLYYELKAVALAFLVFGGGTQRFILGPLLAEGGPLGSPL